MDELLRSIDVPQAPVTRSQVAKQKAAGAPPPKESLTFDLTPLDSLILDGMGADQIWAQLELRAKNVCQPPHSRSLSSVLSLRSDALSFPTE